MMRLLLNGALLIFLLVSLSASVAMGQSQTNSTPLTNAAVIKLVKAGFKEKTVIAIIGSRLTNFDLSTERMIELKRNGVSERVILAMIGRQESATVPDDFWSDEAFLDGDKGSLAMPRNPGGSSPGSTDIFGSGGSVRGTQKDRTGGGSVSQDTETVGSATVRIIRPPSEANTPAKLEKTPTLTNTSVIELVEAGFTEGTIIRRIEQSPVDFDLSPDQLNELRKRRVSDKILLAMKNAMGGDSETTNPPGLDGTQK